MEFQKDKDKKISNRETRKKRKNRQKMKKRFIKNNLNENEVLNFIVILFTILIFLKIIQYSY